MPNALTDLRTARPTAIALLLTSLAAAPASADDARDLAAALRADTEESAMLLQDDGAPMINASLLFQVRYLANTRNDPLPPNTNNQTYGFDIPRAQLRLSGNLINRNLTGYLTMDFGDAEGDRGRGGVPSVPSGNGSPQLREAYLQYNMTGDQEGFYAKVGQFKSPVMTEDAIAPEFQLAVERSVTNEFYAPGMTQGIAVGRVTDRVAWEVSINDGAQYMGNPEPVNTAFNNTLEADWGAYWRLDWKFAGDWARFADFTSWRGSDEGLRVGGAIFAQNQGSTNPDQVVSDIFQNPAQEVTVFGWTLDAQYESDGWALFAGFHGHRIEWEIVGERLLLTQLGWVIQGSYFIDDQFEVFARWDGTKLDSELPALAGTGEDMYDYITAGVNYYMIPESHAAKFTADVVFTRSNSDTFDVLSTSNTLFYPDATVTGLLGRASQEIVVRAQFQALF